jgi:toxin ParE1/3/4
VAGRSRPVRWSSDAEADLLRIIDWIAQRSGQARALDVLERLTMRAASLSRLAARGRAVPEVAAVAEPILREVIEAPWRIVYIADPERVLIVAILDGRRDVADWLRQAGPRSG